jgi:transcription-repair coupling factor (superfamily II helicase)
VKFKNLGLVIIDEEHRFGVRQKEKLKSLRAEVDVLTLTATPIPRTMSMSLEGVRDFSVIATAPERRLAVKTFVRPESNALIREAILRELKRGGQVYFLHNDVDHGQMPEHALERVMREFYQQHYNVLLCTTIIETGIDIPTANTIIIHRADKFGLAQLHQLRGRVGRSHHQAYAYLLTPPEASITKNAEKRLEALQNLEDLGSGFYLAMHDLEIRGAGEVLGERQSGEIANVGFDLYNQMLKEAVRALKRGETPDVEHPFASVAEINLHAPALLPSDYVPDVNQRLGFYKELAAAETPDAIDAVVENLADRYGEIPPQAKTLIDEHRIRLLCEKLGIRKVDASEKVIYLTVADKPKFEPLKFIDLMQSRRDMRMTGPNRVQIAQSTGNVESRIAAVKGILGKLE